MIENWYEFYNYDRNEDLINKLCNKFCLNKPNVRYNCYGGLDISFVNNLHEYLVELDEQNEKFIIKRKDIKNNGLKQTKNYMAICKTFKDGSWYKVVKWIANNSKL